MSVLQGQPLPNVTETTTTAKSGPDYFDTHLEDLAKAGETAMKRTGAESVAGYDPLQTMGYGALPGASTAYKPGLQAAGTTAAKAAAGITPGRIQALMNPYTTNVVNEMARLSNQNVERNLLPGMKAGFVGTGGLGGSRYANALGQSMADVQADLMGQQRGALSAGYTQALKGALDEAQLQNLTAKTQADIAKYEQELGLAGANAMTKAGAERQAYEQSILDAPMRTAKAASDLLRGYTVPSTETRTFTGPRSRDYYGMSDFDKVAGVLSMIGGAKVGKEGEGLNKILGILSKGGATASNIVRGLLDPANASSAAIGQGEIDAMKAAGVYDDYQALIESITNPSENADPTGYYESIFESFEDPSNYEYYDFGYGEN